MCVSLRSKTVLAVLAALPFAASAFASENVSTNVSAVIKLKTRVSMEQLATNVTSPVSTRYGHFYTPQEIRALSAPSTQDYQALLQDLRSEGFTITNESPTHLWISVTASADQFTKNFGARFQFMANGRRRHLTEHSLVASARFQIVESVGGLDSMRVAHPHYTKRTLDLNLDPGGVSQATIKSAYGLAPIYASGVTGKGQHIAVATYDGFNVADVQKFYKDSQLVPGPTVDVVSFNGTAAYDENSAVETQLDAEFSGMIAPGASVHVFTSAANSDAGELQLFTAILDDNRAKVANYSWGSCEDQVTPSHLAEMKPIFARAVAQGVNIMVASGDSGSDSCQNGSTVADWPADSDNVVAVGGTTFAQSGGQIAEKGWSGSGGGISKFFDLPAYQASLKAPYIKRSYPDVSFNANPKTGQAVWAHVNGRAQWIVIGGTSMAAPQWSGYLALVGEARANTSKATLGFLNPIIYGLTDVEKGTMFNDVTVGNNGDYSASPGWDAVTGLGSMQGQNLLNRLVTQ